MTNIAYEIRLAIAASAPYAWTFYIIRKISPTIIVTYDFITKQILKFDQVFR